MAISLTLASRNFCSGESLPLEEEGLLALATKLKNRCGTGGTVKDWRIEIQGDHRETVIHELEALGYTVKRTGG